MLSATVVIYSLLQFISSPHRVKQTPFHGDDVNSIDNARIKYIHFYASFKIAEMDESRGENIVKLEEQLL